MSIEQYLQEAQSVMQDNQFISDQVPAAGFTYATSTQAMPLPADALPNVPAMVATRLQLELLFQDSLIDLSAVTEVILHDPGATLQILRLIGEDYPHEEDRPTRLEDCIASLNMARCYDTVCASSKPLSSHVLEQWQHFRRVAQCAREIAKCVDGFSPEEAYLVGLLYEVGKLPKLLGWKSMGDSTAECNALAVMLADYWHLPKYLLTAIRERQEAATISRWGEVLQMAEYAASHEGSVARN